MNFFGHAVLAAWKCPDSGFVLGSMLPDLAGMLRARPPRGLLPAVARGIDFHHASDHVFHELLDFRALVQQGVAWLTEEHVRRGSARAAAHVGVELMLDAHWASEPEPRRAYAAALGYGDPSGAPWLAWTGAEEGARFETLRRLLLERDRPAYWADTQQIVQRLGRTLRGRPRLELQPSEEPALVRWVEQTRAAVAERAPYMRAALCAGLSGFAVAL
jgi:hypothetical protein